MMKSQKYMDTFTNTILCILLFSGGLQLLLMMQHNDFEPLCVTNSVATISLLL